MLGFARRGDTMMSNPSHPKVDVSYRADIDGLRAVAVLSVLGCHLDVGTFQGGFVGVDVFFVISGYLISSVILAEITNDRFSIAEFYERRIRRIFPALFGMLTAFSAVTLLFVLPSDLLNYGKSLIATTLFCSNLYLWQHSGYFDLAIANPLLHTWSLAVEEQFYIGFPLFLLLARRLFWGYLRIWIAILSVTSFVISVIVVHVDRNMAFYMPFTRAWELMVGSGLSIGMFPPINNAFMRNAGTLAGATLIGYSVSKFSSSTQFPGVAALLPCVGSVLIIGCGASGKSLVSRLLSWRPVVFVGLISYSLYLYHWPVIFLHHLGLFISTEPWAPQFGQLGVAARNVDRLLETATSVALAALSWRFIERPFRSGRLRLHGKFLFALAGAATVSALVVSVIIIVGHGFPSRFSQRALELAAHTEDIDVQKLTRQGVCFITGNQSFDEYNKNLCLHQEVARPNYLLVGDSHAAMLWPALQLSLPAVNFMEATSSGCLPLVHPHGSPQCKQMMDFVYDDYLLTHSVRGLLLEARWRDTYTAGIVETLEWAKRHGIAVTLFGPVPEYTAPLPALEAYALAWHQPTLVRNHRIETIADTDKTMQQLSANEWHVKYISIYGELCSGETCVEFADPAHLTPIMFDTDHLSPQGALFVIHGLIDRHVDMLE